MTLDPARQFSRIHCQLPEGALIGKIVLPAMTSNICFGDAKGQTLFVTSSDKVYRSHYSRRDAAPMLRSKG